MQINRVSDKVINIVRDEKPSVTAHQAALMELKKQQEKRAQADPLNAKLLDTVEQQVEETRRELQVADAIKALSTQARHKDKVAIGQFYDVVPDDIILEENGNKGIKVSPLIGYDEVMDAIQWVIDVAAEGRSFISGPVKQISIEMAVIKFWSNLDVNEQELVIQYDILKRSGLFDKVLGIINQEQLNWFKDNATTTINNYLDYYNSVAGIIERLSFQAKAENAEMDKLLKTIEDNQKVFDQLSAAAKIAEQENALE